MDIYSMWSYFPANIIVHWVLFKAYTGMEKTLPEFLEVYVQTMTGIVTRGNWEDFWDLIKQFHGLQFLEDIEVEYKCVRKHLYTLTFLGLLTGGLMWALFSIILFMFALGNFFPLGEKWLYHIIQY